MGRKDVWEGWDHRGDGGMVVGIHEQVGDGEGSFMAWLGGGCS